MDINFVWAVAQIRNTEEIKIIKELQDDTWEIVCSLITNCGYRIKGLRGGGFRQIPPKEFFLKKITNSDELILERLTEDDKKDFGNTPESYDVDASILEGVLDIVFDCLKGPKPYNLLNRPKRNMRNN